MSDGGVIIRRLSEADIGEHRQALLVYSKSFEEPGTYEGSPPDDSYLTDLLARPDFIQLAAWSDGQLVGALSAYVLPKFEQESCEIYIYDLAVLEAFRRQGIAEGLIRELGPIGKEAGAHAVFVQADKGDDIPAALYSKLGRPEDVLHFDLAILD